MSAVIVTGASRHPNPATVAFFACTPGQGAACLYSLRCSRDLPLVADAIWVASAYAWDMLGFTLPGLRITVRQLVGLVAFEAFGIVGTIGAAHDAAASTTRLNAVAFVLVTVAIAAAVFARLAPTAACAITLGLVLAYGLARFPGGPIYVAVPVVLYRAVDPDRPRRSLVLGLVAFAAQIAGSAATNGFANLAQGIGGTVFSLGWIAAPLVLGHFLATRRAYVGSLAERARLAEQTRDEEAQRRVTEERLRIARELHDVLAHTISVINVQAGMAAHVMDTQPEQARQAMSTVRQTSREAMRELRNVLDVLREEPHGEQSPPPPAPGLAQLAALVATMTQAGLPTNLTTTGEQGELPPVVELAAYRIVQESLTNVLRHAHASRADVMITRTPGELRIEISNDGTAVLVEGNGSSRGHGITGMRERAASLGGHLEAGPQRGGGFRVEAVLPVGDVVQR